VHFQNYIKKFIGYMINQIGIEVNPDKVKAMPNIKYLTTVKETQELTGCIDAFKRFMSRLVSAVVCSKY